jgi:hypothetical protein
MVEKLCLSNIEKNPAAVPQDYWNPYAVLLEIYTSRKDYRKEMDLWTKLYALYPNDQSIKERIAQLQTTIDNAKAGTATTDSSAITQPNSKK